MPSYLSKTNWDWWLQCYSSRVWLKKIWEIKETSSRSLLKVRITTKESFSRIQSDSRKLFESVRKKIFSFPDETLIYPAHDYKGFTSSTVIEEKLHNPRLSLEKTESEFIDIMKNLNLSHPKKIKEAVPANLNCGNNKEVKKWF